jgi:polar amino acid transport system substrate-binding protein
VAPARLVTAPKRAYPGAGTIVHPKVTPLRIVLPALPLLLCLICAPAHAAITVTTEDYPPFNTVIDGKLAGISTDLVKAIFERAAVPYTIKVLPWARAYAMALELKDTCVYSTTVSDERRPLFQWVGPLVENDWTLYGHDSRHLDIKTLADAKRYRIGAYQGAGISDFLTHGGFNVDTVPHDPLNIQKLLHDRIDLWATGSEAEPYLAWQANAMGIVPLLTFKQVAMSLACNKATDPATIGRLQEALDDIRGRRR